MGRREGRHPVGPEGLVHVGHGGVVVGHHLVQRARRPGQIGAQLAQPAAAGEGVDGLGHRVAKLAERLEIPLVAGDAQRAVVAVPTPWMVTVCLKGVAARSSTPRLSRMKYSAVIVGRVLELIVVG